MFCWELIVLYALFNVCESYSYTLRNRLWLPIEQFCSKKIQVGLFSHLYDLSLRWHLSRKTGSVIQIMRRSSNSTNLLSDFLFRFAPALFDISVSIIFFAYLFDWYFGIIVIVAMCFYSRKHCTNKHYTIFITNNCA